MEKIELSNQKTFPVIGMGTYPLSGKELTNAALSAVKCGYRLFDTAHSYPNEASLGTAIQIIYQKTNITREDLFITSKVGENLDHGLPDGRLFYARFGKLDQINKIVRMQVEDSLRKLQTNYIDLLLIHWPFPDAFVKIWKCFEQLYNEGIVRAIGVSNCRERHILKIMDYATIIPMVNQIQVSPLNTRKDLLKFCNQHHIIVEAYSPLQCLRHKNIIQSNVLHNLSNKYKKSIAQIILRWHIQQNIIPIPKSGNSDRQQQNINIFDFSLSKEDMSLIDNMNINYQDLPESHYCPGY